MVLCNNVQDDSEALIAEILPEGMTDNENCLEQTMSYYKGKKADFDGRIRLDSFERSVNKNVDLHDFAEKRQPNRLQGEKMA